MTDDGLTSREPTDQAQERAMPQQMTGPRTVDRRVTLAEVAWPEVPAQMATTMAVTFLGALGSPDVLVPGDLDVPRLGQGEVLVRVGAVSVGRTLDVAARAGRHPFSSRFTFPHLLGAEHAGTVTAVAAGVIGVEVGDRVCVYPSVVCGVCTACVAGRTEACSRLEIIGLQRPGGYADYTAVPSSNVHVLPPELADEISPATAAALALSGPVSMHQLREAQMVPGDWVLVQGASSALGSVTAALATHLGARVIGTSRSSTKRRILEDLGVVAALDSRSDDLLDQVLALTGGAGVAVVVDDLGDPDMFLVSMAALATLGTLVCSGSFLGGKVELDLTRLYLRSQRVVGVRTGTRSSVEAFWREVDSGFRPRVDAAFHLSEAAEAHRYLEAGLSTGRVVLVPSAGLLAPDSDEL